MDGGFQTMVRVLSGDLEFCQEIKLLCSLASTLIKQCTNKGTQGVQARYGAELPPFISIVQCPGRPVISGVDYFLFTECHGLEIAPVLLLRHKNGARVN